MPEEQLNLDCELLKPMKDGLEEAINILSKNALLTRKESEISLKINIGVTVKHDEDEEYLEPSFEYQLSEKIKEPKSSYKMELGYKYKIDLDDDENVVVQNMNNQQSLFDKEDE